MKLVEKCPVCNGTGQVPYGFYNLTPEVTTTTTGGPITETCRSCNGSGIINLFENELQKAKINFTEFRKELNELIGNIKEEVGETKEDLKEKLIEYIKKI